VTIGAFDPVAVGCAHVVEARRGSAGAARLVGGADPRAATGAALGR